MKLILIDETTLEGLTRENLVSPESIQPLENYFSTDATQQLAIDLTFNALEGFESAAKVHATGKFLAKLGAMISEATLNDAISEVEQYGKNAELFGVKFEVRNTPPVFDFAADETFRMMDEAAKNRKEQLTRAFKSKEALIDEETGEQIPKAVLKKPSGMTVSVSFK